jgi:uncharacterized protein DUF3147
MHIQFDLRALRDTKWHEYVLRFVFGGGVTVLTGILAHRFGPVMGGLFLAIPAIFPASATLIEKHEKEKIGKGSASASAVGQKKAGFDAQGAALGSVGLIAFALVVWKFMPAHSAWLVLPCATLSWALVATILWRAGMMFTARQE